MTNRRHFWTIPVGAYSVARAQAIVDGAAIPAFEAPWDRPGKAPFPVVRRFTAASPDALASVPDELGAHPFAPLLEGQRDSLRARHCEVPVALDPGTDLDDWETLHWHDIYGPVRVTVEGLGLHGVTPLQSLRDFAEAWSVPRPEEPAEVVDVRPELIRRVGRGGALIDAQLANPDARAEDFVVVYDGGDPERFVRAEARRLGPRAFARHTGLALKVAERAALSRPIADRNVRRALAALVNPATGRVCAIEACELPVRRPNAIYCSKAHTDRACRQRRVAASRLPDADPFAGMPTCRCGTVLLGAAAKRGTCSACSGKAP